LQGDCIDLQVRVADNCYAVLASQGSTKVFKNTRDPGGTLTANGGARSSQAVDVGAASWNSSSAEAKTTATNGMSEARQLMACSVGQGALCAVLPQPVTAFRDARCQDINSQTSVSFPSFIKLVSFLLFCTLPSSRRTPTVDTCALVSLLYIIVSVTDDLHLDD
jgi:urease accessory protein UreH